MREREASGYEKPLLPSVREKEGMRRGRILIETQTGKWGKKVVIPLSTVLKRLTSLKSWL